MKEVGSNDFDLSSFLSPKKGDLALESIKEAFAFIGLINGHPSL